LKDDKIVDPWEATKEKEADYQPVIGILTQPKKGFKG